MGHDGEQAVMRAIRPEVARASRLGSLTKFEGSVCVALVFHEPGPPRLPLTREGARFALIGVPDSDISQHLPVSEVLTLFFGHSLSTTGPVATCRFLCGGFDRFACLCGLVARIPFSQGSCVFLYIYYFVAHIGRRACSPASRFALQLLVRPALFIIGWRVLCSFHKVRFVYFPACL